MMENKLFVWNREFRAKLVIGNEHLDEVTRQSDPEVKNLKRAFGSIFISCFGEIGPLQQRMKIFIVEIQTAVLNDLILGFCDNSVDPTPVEVTSLDVF
jgi:hypothetical protein